VIEPGQYGFNAYYIEERPIMDVWFSGSQAIYRHFSAIATYQMVIEEILHLFPLIH
jgi:hypothetical protein